MTSAAGFPLPLPGGVKPQLPLGFHPTRPLTPSSCHYSRVGIDSKSLNPKS